MVKITVEIHLFQHLGAYFYYQNFNIKDFRTTSVLKPCL